MNDSNLAASGVFLTGEWVALDGVIERVEPLDPDLPALAALDLFLGDDSARVMPVVAEGRPIGLVNRHRLIETFTLPFRRDLFRKAPVHQFMDASPTIVAADADIDDVAQLLVKAGLSHLLDGFIIVDAEGQYCGMGDAHGLLTKITERKQEHLYHLAHFDPLTELPNRILFRQRLEASLATARRSGRCVAVVFLDLDKFKRVNDTLGHPCGDQLLRAVGRRISSTIRETDTLSRLGGDEFTPRSVRPHAARGCGRRGPQDTRPTHVSDSHRRTRDRPDDEPRIAVYPDDGTDPDELIRKSDVALYEAKTAGRDTFRFYDELKHFRDSHALDLERSLREALARLEIRPRFQPIVDATSRRPVGIEALATWQHAQRGAVPASTFVPLAEDTGLIDELGKQIAAEALRISSSTRPLDPLWLSINSSAREIRREGYVDGLLAMLRDASFPATRLQVELTERLFLEPTDDTLAELQRLRDAGVRIAIDDFGTGSTSLSHLHVLPIDVIKIDRRFVEQQSEHPRVDALICAMVDMAHALDLEVVAEGVQTEEQAHRLTELGCDAFQGFLFARPLENAALVDWLDGDSQPRSTRH